MKLTAKFLVISATTVMVTLINSGCVSPLQRAAHDGDIREIVRLTDEGRDIDEGSTWYGYPPIYLAVANKQTETTKFLIERGADLKTASRNTGWTPLHVAVGRTPEKTDPEIIKMLIDAGVELNKQDNQLRRTPLHVAAENGQLEAVKLLIEAGADSTLLTSQRLSAADLARKSKSRDKQAILELLKNNVNRKPTSARVGQMPPESVEIPHMNAPE